MGKPEEKETSFHKFLTSRPTSAGNAKSPCNHDMDVMEMLDPQESQQMQAQIASQ